MTKWPSAKHFASWLDNRITGGKVKSSKTKPSAERGPRRHCAVAANALHRSDSALRARASCAGRKRHLGASQGHHRPAHKLARLIYSMLRYGQD